MNLQLPADMNAFLSQLVADGRYPSDEEAIIEGLRLLMSREQLRAEVQKGLQQLDDDQGIDGDLVFDEIERELNALEVRQQTK